ncbi:MAG TPA: type IX secretion system membrane protein PorP/SprF [Bacteroidetes bacterium]|nr:type IX secretion system membrane protein PorP/SprF [Bacteroidota bacterium]
MKNYIFLLLFTTGLGLGLYAQQDRHFSQYMFNHLALNPAYAGKDGFLASTLIFRKQWIGIEGAPSTQSFAMHGPSRNDRHGFGLQFYNDEIGVTKNTVVNLDYAFRIHLSETARLSFGLQGTMGNYRADLNGVRTGSDIDPAVGGDPAFTGAANVNLWIPNAGAGVFFHTQRFYLGASAPRLIEQSLAQNKSISSAIQSRHYFFTTGLVLGADHAVVKFRPSILVKYQDAAPVQFDLNAHFLIADRLWLGASYRTQDAIVLMAELNLSTFFRIGYAYDITTSDLKNYSTGSHEFMLGFDLNFHKRAMISPRYF